MDNTQRSVLLVLHDVAPQTWPDYKPFVEAVDALGNIPMTLLVVPDFHKHSPVSADSGFQTIMGQRLARGDELALHGFYHCDDGPAPRTPRDYFMRRVFTWEGEFYALERQQALTRLHAGIQLFDRLGWPLHGFVAPAWLMSSGTREALRELPFAYTSDPQHFYTLPDFCQIDAPGIVWSARSSWRRGVSKLISDHLEMRFQSSQTIRLGLHPVDMRHPYSRDYWMRLIQRLVIGGRKPMTKAGWLANRGAAARAVA